MKSKSTIPALLIVALLFSATAVRAQKNSIPYLRNSRGTPVPVTASPLPGVWTFTISALTL